MTLTVGSLFSGVGGFDLGFERAGFAVRWQCEIDPSCRDVLAHNFPDVEVVYSNVLTIDRHMLAPVDIIIGGFPCQDLSVAGRRAGLGGERSGLFYEFVRIIRELRPRFAVFENVPGLLSSRGGRDFAAVLAALADIGAVDIAWCVLDAQWFGVPQRRRRVFLVADFGGECASEILSLPEGLRRNRPPRRETGQGVAGTIGGGAGERGWPADTDGMTFLPVAATLSAGGHPHSNTPGRHAEDDVNLVVAGPLTNRYGKGVNTTMDDGAMVVSHAFTIQTNDGGDHRRADRPNGGIYVKETDTALTIGSSDQTVIAFSQNDNGRDATSGIAPTLRVRGDAGWGNAAITYGLDWQQGGSSEDVTSTLNVTRVQAALERGSMGVRRLTPVECERLMGWPDDWTRYGASGKEMADSTRYRMAGNGVVASVSEWIARQIVKAMAHEDI